MTTTFPEPVLGTTAVITDGLHVSVEAVVPLNVTVPPVPKLLPAMVTSALTGADEGEMLLMLGAIVTVKLTPLLACPPTVTTTFPLVAPLGTGTAIEVALQLVGLAVVPLNVTVLVPWVDAKFAPVMVTEAPTGPDVGKRLLILGAGVVTVKEMPLLACPLTVTTTFPVLAPLGTGTTIEVALQLVGTADVPLNVTVLEP